MTKKSKYNPRQYSLFGEETPESPSIISGGRDMRANKIICEISELETPRVDLNQVKTLKFISFGSGSSGNCSYIGTEAGGFLIDAGVDMQQVIDALTQNGIPMDSIKGICLTHEHMDHIKYVYTFLRKYKMALFCTNRVLQGILRKHNISRRIKDYHVAIYKEIPFKILDFEITAFNVSHDVSCNSGFNIRLGKSNFVFSTDMGTITDRARFYMEDADYLVIESNYDSKMLENGKYPEYLKSRIYSDVGHLDNKEAAEFIATIAGGRLKNVFLCHLSKDNNTPELALKEVRSAVEAKGFTVGDCLETLEDSQKDIQLMALPRFDATRCFKFKIPV